MTNLRGKVQRLALALLFLVLPVGAQTIDSMVNAVSDSALFSTIAGLQAFGTRWYQAGNALQVSAWLREEFRGAGLTDVVLDTFAYNTATVANVVATLRGSHFPGREIIVGAHLDSRTLPLDNAPGADDDASGIAAILEIARVMASSGYHPMATIRFVGFAAEEPGLVGSAVFVDSVKAARRNIVLMINFDMIGYTTSTDPDRHFNIIYYPPDTEISGLVASVASSYTTLKPLTTTVDHANTDSYSFDVAGYPAVTCTEYVDNPYYHTPGDLMSTLDRSYVRDIVRTGLASILLFDGTPASSAVLAADMPSTATLCQNFPNPFNPLTIIKYTVGGVRDQGPGVREAGTRDQGSGVSVKLVVYDLLGREVAVLVNERKLPGIYEVTFDGSGLPSGVYFYRMQSGLPDRQAGLFVQSRKMLLVR
jgi:hypothetical protein